eukprot:171303-Chlamydomonas_euryale.AAC.1
MGGGAEGDSAACTAHVQPMRSPCRTHAEHMRNPCRAHAGTRTESMRHPWCKRVTRMQLNRCSAHAAGAPRGQRLRLGRAW